MSSVQELRNAMQAGTIVPQTSLEDIKFIGRYIFGKLRAQNLLTAQQLIQHTANMNLNQVKDFLTRVAQNRHANQCAPVGGRNRRRARAGLGAAQPAAPAPAAQQQQQQYHVREVNRSGFNTLRNLLVAARHEWNQFQHAARIPREHNVRDAPTALCSCVSSQQACAAQQGCRWATQNQQSLCIPTTRNAGFEGLDGFSGQRKRAFLRNQGLQFVRGWRVPDPYA